MSARDPRRRQIATLAVAGVAASIVALVVLLQLDRGGGEERGRAPTAFPSDLPEPTPLTEAERRGAARGIEASGAVGLERGAWVQVAAPDGSLEQEYRADRVDPLPDGWVKLVRPRAILYRKDGRIVTLAAERGMARIPGRALEGGSLEGAVVIELFRTSVDLSKGEPALIVEASDAEFDGVLGEIRSQGSIAVRSGESRFDGEGLLLRIAPEGGSVDRLTIARATRPAVLVRRASETGSVTPGLAAPTAATGEATAAAGAPTAATGAPAAATGAPAAATGAPAAFIDAPTESSRFYRLVLERDVKIRRWLGPRRTDLAGDRLEAVFSLEETRAGNLIADRRGKPAWPVASAGDPFVALVLAGRSDDPDLPVLPLGPPAEGDEIATVEFAGSLTLVPLAASDPTPARPDAIEATLVGTPARLVDSGDKATVTAASFRFRSIDDSVFAEGDGRRRLEIDSPRLAARGRSFSLSRKDGRGTFTGPGEVRLGEGGEEFERLASDPSRPLPEAGPAKAVAISFGEAVDLELATGDSAGFGALRSATFRGGVEAAGEDFSVKGRTLAAIFAPDGDDGDLRELRVEGEPVDASRRGAERGTLLARRLTLSLSPDGRGEPAPASLRAEGGVIAADADQAMRATALGVGFVDDAAGSREIGPVAAEGDVAIALADGVRAWGGRLDADAVARTVRIQAHDAHAAHGSAAGGHPDGVAIARDRTLVDRVAEVRFAEEGSAAVADGPGRVRSFAAGLVGEGLELSPRPAPESPPTLLAEWNRGLAFRETEAGGELDLAGGVRVRSTPDRSSTDALDAATVKLTLAPKDRDRGADARELDAFVASGADGLDAKLESRRWADPARTGDPRLLRLTGGEIRYRPPTREGEVPGPGTLLVHLPAGEGGSGGEVAAGGVSLGAEGTTRFRWSRGLTLRSAGGTDRFRVDLDGDVEALHAGIGEGTSAGEAFSLRADRIGVELERRVAAGADAGVDLGGTAEIIGLDASGRVTARTARMDVECGSFRFEASTRIATIAGLAGRDVSVLFRDGTPPIRAAEVRWDLAKGEIKATRVSGGR